MIPKSAKTKKPKKSQIEKGATEMGGTVKTPKKKAKPDDSPAVLYVNTDRRTLNRFHAACKVEGITIQRKVNEFMQSVVSNAAIGPA